MPFVDVEDGRLFYEISGEGTALVLIHSAWASQKWWRWQVPVLNKHYKVITIDVRGHGQSTALHSPSSVEDLTNDLETFLKKIAVDDPVLIGWSMGGMISMQYCLNHPQNVKALVLIATSGHRIPGLKLKICMQYLQALAGLFMDIAQPRKFDRTTREFPRQNAWLTYHLRNTLSPAASQEIYNWILSDITRNPRENFFAVIKSLWNWEAGEKLTEIGIPTLIMAGKLDTLAPPRCAQGLHEAIPNSKLVVVENASHYLVMERPEIVNQAILNFLKDIGC